jgi:electron transfer flavoprotein alpha/beta subunit
MVEQYIQISEHFQYANQTCLIAVGDPRLEEVATKLMAQHGLGLYVYFLCLS